LNGDEEVVVSAVLKLNEFKKEEKMREKMMMGVPSNTRIVAFHIDARIVAASVRLQTASSLV